MSLRSVNGLVTLGLRRERQEVERWISGGAPGKNADFDSLRPFMEALRDRRTGGSDSSLQELARTAAAESIRVSDQRKIRPPKKRAIVVRPAFATIALLVALLLPGMAFAADDAAPGELLYPVDQALELIGIGDGSVEERIGEAATLVRSGNTERALVFVGENLEEAVAVGDRHGAAMLEETLLVIADIAGVSSPSGHGSVADLQEFIEANKGKGVGLDGKDFGQAVADIARAKKGSNKPDDTGSEGRGNNANSPLDTPAGETDDKTNPGQENSDGQGEGTPSAGNDGNGQGNSGQGNSGQGNSGQGNSGQGNPGQGNAKGNNKG